MRCKENGCESEAEPLSSFCVCHRPRPEIRGARGYDAILDGPSECNPDCSSGPKAAGTLGGNVKPTGKEHNGREGQGEGGEGEGEEQGEE